MRLLALVVACLLLSGCGGGGGGGHDVAVVINTAAAMRADLLFGYFGVSAAQQLRETAAHCNMAFLAGWGDWSSPQSRQLIADRIVAEATEAVSLGITNLVVFVDWAIFTPQYGYRGLGDLQPFVERLKTAGLWNNVAALYPVDEPDLQKISGGQMTLICNDLRAQFGKPLAVIFGGNRQYPGVAAFDWCGFDHYGKNVFANGDVADLKSRLRPTQRLLLVPGGCNPWHEAPRPFLDYANTDQQVIGIVAFIYGDQWGGTENLGIRSNYMLPEYVDVGTRIKKGT